MVKIICKYEKKLQECAKENGTLVPINDATKILRSALKEYRSIYKEDRRFDFWGNEIK